MSTTIQNKRRFPFVPVLLFVSVFSAIIYYGYVHFFQKKEVIVNVKGGLNNVLPVQEPAKTLNKLEMYMKAEKDSAIKTEQRSNDPYSKPVPEIVSKTTSVKPNKIDGYFVKSSASHSSITEKEVKIDQQLAGIKRLMNESKNNTPQLNAIKLDDTVIEQQSRNAMPDPELKQLEGMLDKLIEIQHPQLVKERYRQIKDSVSLKTATKTMNGSVSAVVHNTQVLSNGSTIKLRLTQNLLLNGDTVPKGNFVYGTCSINNERLSVSLTNLTCRNEIVPVSLSVYDIDGIEGIYIPGAISREVAKEGTEQAIQSVGFGGYAPSFTAQVAGAGLQATKAFLSRKVKMVRVTVKAGHRILLQNTHGG